MSKSVFIAFFYVIGLAFLGLGVVELFSNVRFTLGHEQGTMTSTDPTVALVAKLPESERNYGTTANVIYTTSQGRIEVPRQRLSGKMTERLARGESIPVRFLPSDPHTALFDDSEMEMNWVGLIGGALALAIAIFAHRLMRKEAGLA